MDNDFDANPKIPANLKSRSEDSQDE